MTKLKIDENYISALAQKLRPTLKSLENDLYQMTDKDNDIFKRYMSQCRVVSFLLAMETAFTLHNNSFRQGHELNDEIFNTQACKNSGWRCIDIDENPFFINKDDNEENHNCAETDSSELPKEVIEAIETALKNIDTKH